MDNTTDPAPLSFSKSVTFPVEIQVINKVGMPEDKLKEKLDGIIQRSINSRFANTAAFYGREFDCIFDNFELRVSARIPATPAVQIVDVPVA